MARWAGWGAGPSGAGATGGPSRAFLVAALVGSGVVAVVLLRDGRPIEALVAALAAVYFGLRAAGRLGRRRG
ncbi:MAG TPA: hypothetical protein VLD85_04655 [Anaeromyxobacteraceae bacterium]|nr:hypothetical protein [Anaeromyxobacteraceae bacterium]